ncbi:MAG: outer membrane beta-barrel protein [Gammaproteobacteria bacterium]|jgi:hypothetical protein
MRTILIPVVAGLALLVARPLQAAEPGAEDTWFGVSAARLAWDAPGADPATSVGIFSGARIHDTGHMGFEAGAATTVDNGTVGAASRDWNFTQASMYLTWQNSGAFRLRVKAGADWHRLTVQGPGDDLGRDFSWGVGLGYKAVELDYTAYGSHFSAVGLRVRF